MIEIECKILNSYILKLYPIFHLFNLKLLKYLFNKKAILEDSFIKKSIKLKKSLNKIKLIKLKKIKSIKSNKNKWCQNWSGLKILHIKSIQKINKWSKNMPLSSPNLKSNKKINKFSLNNSLWRKNKMPFLKPKFNNIKSFSIKSVNKWNNKKSNKNLLLLINYPSLHLIPNYHLLIPWKNHLQITC